MMAYTFTTYYWLYLVSWVEEPELIEITLDDGEVVYVEDPNAFTDQTAIDQFGLSMQIGMVIALVAMPLFGYLNDKKNVDK